jgi:hypothetical protein
VSEKTVWPDLPLAAWSETCDTLQLWTQIVGKIRIALTPLINHWWNATLLVTGRGLSAPAMPYAGRTFDVSFDFANHRLVIETSDCRVEHFALKPMAVADFYHEFMERNSSCLTVPRVSRRPRQAPARIFAGNLRSCRGVGEMGS